MASALSLVAPLVAAGPAWAQVAGAVILLTGAVLVRSSRRFRGHPDVLSVDTYRKQGE